VKANLSAYVKAAEEELVVITRTGKPVVVLLPMEDDEELERLALAYSTRFQAILTEARHHITTSVSPMRTSGVRWSVNTWILKHLPPPAVTKGHGRTKAWSRCAEVPSLCLGLGSESDRIILRKLGGPS
jgi:prevent-host-death family protein